MTGVDFAASYRASRRSGHSRARALRALALRAGLDDAAVRIALAEGQAIETRRVQARVERRKRLAARRRARKAKDHRAVDRNRTQGARKRQLPEGEK